MSESKTAVGHTKADETDVYVGRGQNGRHLLSVAEPGQRGWLGNPFTLDEYTREESVAKYREAFEDKLQRDDAFRAAVADLAGQTLGCWCQHLDEDGPACHAEVIAEWAETLATRLSWPRRRRDDGTPIVGWTCDNCGHEVEAPYKPSRLARCPECGGNPQGVRAWDVEPTVEARQERLRDQLAARYGPEGYPGDDPACAACGTTEDVHICPGEELDDFEWRCDDCRRFPKWFWQPGDHPSLLVRDWIETCDRCDAEFTTVFGVTFWIDGRGSSYHTEDVCLQCVDAENVRQELEDGR
ncbi:DUF4326 domain-containing protein [Haloarcula sp. JP-L23]|uniref:DUF4326 domain-containing protein n=1 Tax=Haloarcula sp. JP-L23 TaxID=2716717 RepID=UPI00140EF1CF|nr:DUF4326 domain-containing protein [Haloarcula sp. JP-L23]